MEHIYIFGKNMHFILEIIRRARWPIHIMLKRNTSYYYMSIEIYVKYSAEIKFVFHCILYFSHVKKVVSAL